MEGTVSIFERILNFCDFWIQVSFGVLMSIILITVMSIQFLFGISTWPFAIAIAGITFVWLWLVFIFRNEYHHMINERDIGIVFKNNGDFDTLVKSGTHYFSPRHRKIETRLRIKGNKAEGQTVLRTKEGILVTVVWETKYSFVEQVLLNGDPEQQREWGYSLMKPPFGKVVGITMGALREVVEKMRTVDLYFTDKDTENTGLLNYLEKIVTEMVQARLGVTESDSILTEDSGKVTIKMIELPPRIESAIEDDFKQRLYQAQGHPYKINPRPNQYQS
jgi:hypothetical protein